MVAVFNGGMDKVADAIFKSLTESVDISIKLLGPIALWLGIMNIARESGLTKVMARIIKPLFKFVFPDVPPEHPAAGSILLNISANILGLGNSATPLGISAMKDLQQLNPDKSTASPAMCTLLALNTSSLTLIPATIISLRAAHSSINPAIIMVSTIFATSVSTLTALLLDKTFRIFYGI